MSPTNNALSVIGLLSLVACQPDAESDGSEDSPARVRHEVRVTLRGDPGARVEFYPEGEACGTLCPLFRRYPAGSQVVLVAFPSDGFAVAVLGRDGCTSYESGVRREACWLIASDPVNQVELRFAERVHTPWGLRWENPLPQSNSLEKLWGSRPDDMWAVGDNGTLLHHDGVAWSGLTGVIGLEEPWQRALRLRLLLGVYGLAAPDGGPSLVWAVGVGGVILHHDGKGWRHDPGSGQFGPNTDLYGVFGFAPDDLWAVGNFGSLLRRRGGRWSADPQSGAVSGHLNLAIWGSGSSDLWVVGVAGTILHYDGVIWKKDPRSGVIATRNLNALWGSGPDDVWAVGDGGVVLHRGRAGWTDESARLCTTYDLKDVRGGPDGLIVVGKRPGMDGAPGVVARFDGSVWTCFDASAVLRGVHGAWVVGDGLFALPPGPVKKLRDNAQGGWFNAELRGVWAPSPDQVYIVGNEGSTRRGAILHHNGQALWNMTIGAEIGPTDNIPILHAVHGVVEGERVAWAVGARGLILQLVGETWSVKTTGSDGKDLYDVHVAARDAAWAVGQAGSLWRYDGRLWQKEALPGVSEDLHGVLSLDQRRALIVGTQGLVGRYEDGAFTPLPRPSAMALRGVTRCPDGVVYVVGDGGTILRDGGDGLRGEESGTRLALRRVRCRGAGAQQDVIAVGDAGTLVRRQRGAWAPLDTGTRQILYGLDWTDEDLWLVGSMGTVLLQR